MGFKRKTPVNPIPPEPSGTCLVVGRKRLKKIALKNKQKLRLGSASEIDRNSPLSLSPYNSLSGALRDSVETQLAVEIRRVCDSTPVPSSQSLSLLGGNEGSVPQPKPFSKLVCVEPKRLPI